MKVWQPPQLINTDKYPDIQSRARPVGPEGRCPPDVNSTHKVHEQPQ